MNLSVSKGTATANKVSTLVVFVPQQSSSKVSLPGADKDVVALLKHCVEDGHFKGGKEETLSLLHTKVEGAEHLLFVGLGDVKTNDYELVRRVSSVAYSKLKSLKATGAGFDLLTLTKHTKDNARAVRAAVEGIELTAYSMDEYKGKAAPKKKKSEEGNKIERIVFLAGGKMSPASLKKAISEGQIISEGVNFTRRLGDLPGNLMTPAILASEVQKAAKGTGLIVTVFDKARIKKERMGGLLGVSLGSDKDPRFIMIEYKGAAASRKPIALVGKGLTFDAGGISLKPAASMDEMKYDMQGGAAVIGTMLAIAKLKLKANVVAYVPATENMPGPGANKPGDILTARNGKTIEVLNTDAEGRLILADALVYATEKKPKLVMDAATLTGAMVVALGNTYTGVHSRDNNLVKKVQEAADKSDENMWPMPIHDDHSNDMKGVFADLQNISNFRGAGSSTAAAFLENFIENDVPWAHFDIAGTGWNQGNRHPYCPKKGATGALVRTWVEFIRANG
jgi:leucyl aminopeptidase